MPFGFGCLFTGGLKCFELDFSDERCEFAAGSGEGVGGGWCGAWCVQEVAAQWRPV